MSRCNLICINLSSTSINCYAGGGGGGGGFTPPPYVCPSIRLSDMYSVSVEDGFFPYLAQKSLA